MRKPGGLFITSHGDGSVTEVDSFTCGHCNRPVAVPVKQRPEDIGGLCKQCMSMTCPRCTAAGHCTPFEKELERQEARGRALRSYGLGA
jgi:hypothetical protein